MSERTIESLEAHDLLRTNLGKAEAENAQLRALLADARDFLAKIGEDSSTIPTSLTPRTAWRYLVVEGVHEAAKLAERIDAALRATERQDAN